MENTTSTAHSSGKLYVLAWLSLMLLTLGSVLATRIELGDVGLLFALLIAAVKATIVMIIFMHLNRERFTARFVAIINVLWVALICLGIFADVGAR